MSEGSRRRGIRERWMMAWKRSRSCFVLLLILTALGSFFPAFAPLPALSSSSSRLHDPQVRWFPHFPLKLHLVIYQIQNPKNPREFGESSVTIHMRKYTSRPSIFRVFLPQINDREAQRLIFSILAKWILFPPIWVWDGPKMGNPNPSLWIRTYIYIYMCLLLLRSLANLVISIDLGLKHKYVMRLFSWLIMLSCFFQ